ncbi:MAG: hypothetical protein ABL958_01160 [Bdellovibrionia bacterium]
MKNVIAALALVFVSTTAFATGLKRQVYNCEKGSGDSYAQVQVTSLQISAPGRVSAPTYIASIKEAKRAGLANSGWVDVVKGTPVFGGDTEVYFGLESKLMLRILKKSGVNGSGRAANILVTATFQDEKRKSFKGSLNEVWLSCK